MAFREIDDDLWEIVRNHLPPRKPHIGRPRRDPRLLFNGVLYVLTTGCTWSEVPAKYGTKSTVHRYHLELCDQRAYQAIFLDLLRSGYEFRKGEETGRCEGGARGTEELRNRPAPLPGAGGWARETGRMKKAYFSSIESNNPKTPPPPPRRGHPGPPGAEPPSR